MTDWCVGDLAVCVNTIGWIDEHTGDWLIGPEPGWTGKVTGVRVDEDGDTMLLFAEWDDRRGYIARAFRKIRPDTHEACEAEFVTLLKRTKRKVEA